jgi:hypothetical protein
MSNRLTGFAWMLAAASGSAVLFWLLRDHWGHAFGYAPFLLFLTCPLMHLFMHHGHKHEDHRNGHSDHPTDHASI